jgi:hypothetical protein
MKAFISYSHNDAQMLDILHKHLAQLQRDKLITTWTDRDIMPGAKLNSNISDALLSSQLFIALLSPDYIASNYCYEKEFETALGMQEQGAIIVPVIVEPCDWLNTPFKDFKALPKDGKAISTWENKSNAFLDVVQNLRKLITSTNTEKEKSINPISGTPSRNYRVQKDFDSIEKMEFVEKTLHEIKDYLKRYLEELILIDNIKTRILVDNEKQFESLLVNRNKIATESQLKLWTNTESFSLNTFRSNERQLNYAISGGNHGGNKTFTLELDKYHLFWKKDNYSRSEEPELNSKEMSDLIWNEWLESVGIL